MVGILFAVAGNLLRSRAHLPIFVPRRIVDLNGVDRTFHRRDRRGEVARTRYHLRLFRSRERTLEFSTAHRRRSLDFHSASRALVRERTSTPCSSAMIARALIPLLLLVTFVGSGSAGDRKEWVRLTDCHYLEAKDNDGDSFRVHAGDKEFTARLYYVDAPETNLRQGERTHDQSLYFGITLDETMKPGEMAQQRAKELLQSPFLIWTKWAPAAGVGRESRYYVIVEVDGKSLGEIL